MSTPVLGPIDAGKLPSEDQVNQVIDSFNKYSLTQVEPSGDDLNSQGLILADGVRDIVDTFKRSLVPTKTASGFEIEQQC